MSAYESTTRRRNPRLAPTICRSQNPRRTLDLTTRVPEDSLRHNHRLHRLVWNSELTAGLRSHDVASTCGGRHWRSCRGTHTSIQLRRNFKSLRQNSRSLQRTHSGDISRSADHLQATDLQTRAPEPLDYPTTACSRDHRNLCKRPQKNLQI